MMAVSSFLNSRLVGKIGMRRCRTARCSASRRQRDLVRAGRCSAHTVPAFVLLSPPPCSSSAGSARTSTPSRWSRSATSPAPPRPCRVSSRRWAAASIGAAHRQAFDGTTTPLALGFCGVALGGLVMVLIAERGKLFRVQHKPIP
jgi:DHA1 family bicyclomycin/chloramphenicol resistance-like MFS transporter